MTADSDLSRAHPLTVIARTVTALVQAFGALVAVAVLGVLGEGAGGSGGLAFAALGGFIMLFTAVAILGSWLTWVYFRYGIVGSDLVIVHGVLIRHRRAIPLARVQGVDIRAGVVMRLMGLVEIVVQTADGGEDAEARIGAIPLAEAERLRDRMLHARRAADAALPASAPDGPPASAAEAIDRLGVGADPVTTMSDLRGVFGGAATAIRTPSFEYRLPFGRLVLAAVTSKGMLFAMAAIAGFLIQGAEILSASALDDIPRLAVPVLAGALLLGVMTVMLAAAGITIAKDFGFTVRRVDDRIETESGLFERRMLGIPVRRIQATRVEQTPLQRLLGYAAVYADTAGFGREDQDRSFSATTLVPLAKASEIRPLLHVLLPEAERMPSLSRVPRRALRFYVLWPVSSTALIDACATVLTGLLGLVQALASAMVWLLATAVVFWLRVLAWRHAAYGAEAGVLGLTSGSVGLSAVRLPRSRIQSMSLRQTFFQRRARLATLTATAVSGSGRSSFHVRNLDADEGRRLLDWYLARTSSPASGPDAKGAAPSSP